MIKLKVKTGDKIIVITGNHKGKTGNILKVYPSKNKVIISGINLIKRHIKPSIKNNNKGNIIEREAPIHISNVAIIDPINNICTKIGFKIVNQEKLRIYKKSGKIIYNKYLKKIKK